METNQRLWQVTTSNQDTQWDSYRNLIVWFVCVRLSNKPKSTRRLCQWTLKLLLHMSAPLKEPPSFDFALSCGTTSSSSSVWGEAGFYINRLFPKRRGRGEKEKERNEGSVTPNGDSPHPQISSQDHFPHQHTLIKGPMNLRKGCPKNYLGTKHPVDMESIPLLIHHTHYSSARILKRMIYLGRWSSGENLKRLP